MTRLQEALRRLSQAQDDLTEAAKEVEEAAREADEAWKEEERRQHALQLVEPEPNPEPVKYEYRGLDCSVHGQVAHKRLRGSTQHSRADVQEHKHGVWICTQCEEG